MIIKTQQKMLKYMERLNRKLVTKESVIGTEQLAEK